MVFAVYDVYGTLLPVSRTLRVIWTQGLQISTAGLIRSLDNDIVTEILADVDIFARINLGRNSHLT